MFQIQELSRFHSQILDILTFYFKVPFLIIGVDYLEQRVQCPQLILEPKENMSDRKACVVIEFNVILSCGQNLVSWLKRLTLIGCIESS